MTAVWVLTINGGEQVLRAETLADLGRALHREEEWVGDPSVGVRSVGPDWEHVGDEGFPDRDLTDSEWGRDGFVDWATKAFDDPDVRLELRRTRSKSTGVKPPRSTRSAPVQVCPDWMRELLEELPEAPMASTGRTEVVVPEHLSHTKTGEPTVVRTHTRRRRAS